MSDTVKYDYEGIIASIEACNKSIAAVTAAKDDVNQIISSLHEVFKTPQVAEAQSAVYRQLIQQLDTDVIAPLHEQVKYLDNCKTEAEEGDRALSGGWG